MVFVQYHNAQTESIFAGSCFRKIFSHAFERDEDGWCKRELCLVNIDTANRLHSIRTRSASEVSAEVDIVTASHVTLDMN